jgi:protein TonB
MLEVKKSPRADLEGKRTQRFMLGLLVALACLFVGLEYTLTPDDPLDDPDLLEMLSTEEELSPLLRPENELALAPKVEPKPTVKLVVADDDAEQDLQQEEEPVETDVDSDMAAMEDDIELEPPAPVDDDVVSFRVVEDMPQFPGGPTELMKFLTRNLKYPKAVEQQKQQGKVVAEFIVNKDGSVTDVKIVASFNAQCDREVLRVLRMMPRWTAGIQNNEPCRTKVCIPIVFRL